MRLIVLLLLIGCSPPARYGVGLDWVHQDNSSAGSTEFVDGEHHSAANSWGYDQDPYPILKGWLEWDNAPEYRDMSWLSDPEKAREPLPKWDPKPEPDPDPHVGHSWWQEQVEHVLAFDADKLLIMALLIFMFKKDIVRFMPSWLKRRSDEEGTDSK